MRSLSLLNRTVESLRDSTYLKLYLPNWEIELFSRNSPSFYRRRAFVDIYDSPLTRAINDKFSLFVLNKKAKLELEGDWVVLPVPKKTLTGILSEEERYQLKFYLSSLAEMPEIISVAIPRGDGYHSIEDGDNLTLYDE